MNDVIFEVRLVASASSERANKAGPEVIGGAPHVAIGTTVSGDVTEHRNGDERRGPELLGAVKYAQHGCARLRALAQVSVVLMSGMIVPGVRGVVLPVVRTHARSAEAHEREDVVSGGGLDPIDAVDVGRNGAGGSAGVDLDCEWRLRFGLAAADRREKDEPPERPHGHEKRPGEDLFNSLLGAGAPCVEPALASPYASEFPTAATTEMVMTKKRSELSSSEPAVDQHASTGCSHFELERDLAAGVAPGVEVRFVDRAVGEM